MQRGTPKPAMRIPSSLQKIFRALRLVGWNAFFLVVGLSLIGFVGEAWLRVTAPFVGTYFPKQFVPNVGVLGKPNTKVRWTNSLDFWTVSQTNSLGFVDREILGPERTAASCHIAMIGDSFVEANEVPIADKFHVRLEALAVKELPHLDVTTSAFGRMATGQINQLAFYDEYARRLSPKVVVLVIVPNDFQENRPIFHTLYKGYHPEKRPYVSAVRDENGEISLRPPHPDYLTFRLARGLGFSESTSRGLKKIAEKVRGRSFLLDRLYLEIKAVLHIRLKAGRRERWESLISTLGPHLNGLRPSSDLMSPTSVRALEDLNILEQDEDDFIQDAFDMMAIALDQFKERAERDGVSLMILSTYIMGTRGSFLFDWMRTLAHARDIPVIDQYDYIVRRGGKVEDAHWPHASHWNPTGHQWAAEALLEYLKQHPEICDKPVVKETL